MSKIEIETFILPAHWAVALINGDTSGMTDEDEAAIDDFLVAQSDGTSFIHCVDMGEDEGFMRHHDASDFLPFACDCATFTFHRIRQADGARVIPAFRMA